LGTTANKTVTITSTAEDDTTVLTYKIELDKLKAVANQQQWVGDPFISQYIFQQDYNNYFQEVVNPGTASLDFGQYMFVWGNEGINGPAASITQASGATAADWKYRYRKYIPGLKWAADSDTWKNNPARAMQDITIDPNVKAGDVFVWASMNETPAQSGTYPSFIMPQVDLNFTSNPWGEDLSNPWDGNLKQWLGAKCFVFKILNDSVRTGDKAANDPNDFLLVDCFASIHGQSQKIGGKAISQVTSYFRKPYIFKGDTVMDKSFGTNPTDCEWYWIDENILGQMGYGWPNTRIYVADGLGSHFMNEVTIFKSTISSLVYKLTEGFTLKESLWGIKAGSSIGVFESNIIKADTGQTLTILSHVDGTLIADTSVLVFNGDTLRVVSNDKVNTTKYALTVSDLSSDAVLTSSVYTIGVTGATGTVTGFPYFGTTLKEVVDSVTVPAGARLDVIDANGAYVALQTLNSDTVYNPTQVSNKIYFDVTAENGTTKILYQLIPTSSNSDAFVTSDVYTVDQTAQLISFVPQGATVYGLFRFLTPAPGATFKLIDKYGFDRTVGYVAWDDKLVVTSEDTKVTKVYYLSLQPKLVYFAYVLSTVYVVDQVQLMVDGALAISTSTLASDFLADLTPAPGASLKVVSSLGVENTSTLNIGDKVRVTAGDGITTVDYAINNIFNGVSKFSKGAFNAYPNPSNGNVTLTGIAIGNRIVVSNILGQQIFAKIANQDVEHISLQGQPSGIYFVKISNNEKTVGCYKLIVK
jgi:hypothetical protein